MISAERQAELKAASGANIAAGNAPYADVHISDKEELDWIFEQHNWSGRYFLEPGRRRADLTDADLRSVEQDIIAALDAAP